MVEDAPTTKVHSPNARWIPGIFFVLLALLLLFGSTAVPFLFETSSIKYKFEMDKILLRTGHVLGMAAATLLLLQFSMSARIKTLDRIFSLNLMFSVHRINAVAVAVLALLHPLFVFAPEDIGAIPVRLKYTPEIIGAVLLLLIWVLVASGIWRRFLELSFNRWWILHRVGTLAAVVALAIHVLFVNDVFKHGLPRILIMAAFSVYVLMLARVKLKRFFLKSLRYRVAGVTPLGKDACSIELEPETHPVFDYIPGQFAFLTFLSEHISDEEHPFTISSTPTRPSSLQFNIRCSGDWTRHIGRLRAGDKARIDGPYGRFSHLSLTGQGVLVMIAGGIGITPMLSMLRYMADVNDPRRITLIWSNRTREDVILPDEFRDFEQRLKGLEMTHVFTREPDETGERGRLDRNRLENLLSGCSRESRFFLCGPPRMMQAVHRALIHLGFPSHAIYMEQFRL